MFKEEETQYCPMCEEWAEKYKQLKSENKELKRKNANKRTSLRKKQSHITQLKTTLQDIKEIANMCLCEDDMSKMILEKCKEVLDANNNCGSV